MGFVDVVRNSRREAENGRPLIDRRRDTDVMPQFHRRLAVKAIDEVVFNLARLEKARDIMAMRLAGIEQIGSGAESIVFKIGDRAVKYAKWSEGMSEAERIELACKKVDDFDTIGDYLEPYLLDQTVSVANHPFYKDRRAVQINQPYVKFQSAIIRHPSNISDGVSVASDAPLDQLSNFLDASWRLYGRTGLLVDTNGVDNIVVSDGQLLLLDTQPIGQEVPEIRPIILGQLNLLSSYLNIKF